MVGLRRDRYDVSINTHPQSRIDYRVVARIIGATHRISHGYEYFHLLDRWLVTHACRRITPHSMDNNLKLLSLLGKAPNWRSTKSRFS